MKSEVRIGISGWNYAGWRGVFYPKGLPHSHELEFASRVFNSIEINGSFYSLQQPTSYRRWYEETPENFLFSVKGGRFITHMKKLREVKVPLANFFASGVLALEEKLGPILWQFPPNFGWNEKRFWGFFQLLPKTTKAKDTRLAENKTRSGAALLRGNSARQFSGARFFRAAARIQRRVRLRRYRREMALCGRFDCGFRLLPPPWRYPTLYQRLQRPRARLVGNAIETVAQRTATDGCETRHRQNKIGFARFIRLL